MMRTEDMEMEKMRALNPDELDKVSGGAMGGSSPQEDRRQEFESAWNSLGLSGIYNDNAKKEEEYNKWKNSGFMGSAFDFLLPLTK